MAASDNLSCSEPSEGDVSAPAAERLEHDGQHHIKQCGIDEDDEAEREHIGAGDVGIGDVLHEGETLDALVGNAHTHYCRHGR